MLRLEPAWAALDGWAALRSGQSSLLIGLTRRRLSVLIGELRSASPLNDPKASNGCALSPRWTGLDGAAGRRVRDRPGGRPSCICGVQAVGVAEQATAIAQLVRDYAAPLGWASIDADYLAVQAATEDEAWLRPLRELTDRAYCDYVVKANDRLWSLLEQAPSWPPDGTSRVVGPAWDATSSGRRAVIITDALRLDLAQKVSAEIGPSCVVAPGLTTLPTTTPFGMAALLPTTEPPRVTSPVVVCNSGPAMERTWPRAPAGVGSWSDSCLARARQWNSWNLMTSSGELRQRPWLSRSCSTTHSTTAVMGKDPCRSSCRNTSTGSPVPWTSSTRSGTGSSRSSRTTASFTSHQG